MQGVSVGDQEAFHEARFRRMLASGRIDKAAESLRELNLLAPENLSYLKLSARLHEQLGNDAEAADCYLRLARLYAKQKSFAELARVLDRWQAFHPGSASNVRQELYHFSRQHGCSLAQGLPILEASERIVCFLHEHKAFQALDDHAFSALLNHLNKIELRDGECVARFEEQADQLFFVVTGGLLPVVEGSDGKRHTMALAGPGSIVGETPFLTGEERRTADLCAQGESTVYTLSYLALERLVEKYPVIRDCLEQQRRIHIPERQLGESMFFRAYSAEQRRHFASQMELMDVSADTLLFEHGQRDALDLYVVVSGWFSVSAPVNGVLHHLYTAHSGNLLGELGVLQNVRRLTVRAVSDGQLLRWPEENWRQQYMGDAKLRARLGRRLELLRRKIASFY